MTPHLRGKLQKSAAVALIGGAVAVISLVATGGLAQGQGQASVVLSASVTTIGPHGKGTITAVVHSGHLVPLGGVVTFVDKTNGKPLGAVLLRTKSGAPCTPRASSCRAKLKVSGDELAREANRIVGVFNPDQLYAPSFAGAVWLYRGVSPSCRAAAPSSATQPVFTGGPIAYAAGSRRLCRGRIRSRRGTTDVTVSSEIRTVVTEHTVIAFGSQALPCSTRRTGDLLAYSISGARAPGAFELQVLGRAATLIHGLHPNGYICYGSTKRFETASGRRAKRTANGLYYGRLPYCRDNDADDVFPPHPNGDDRSTHPAPCIEWELYSHQHGRAVWTTWFEPSTGDPRASW
jgi:hypothetical protein